MKPTEAEDTMAQASPNTKPANIKNQYNTNCQQFFGPVYGATFNMSGTPSRQQPAETRDAQAARTMPKELATEAAAVYWKRLQKEGFVDAQGQRMPETTRQQAMYIAEAFADKLRITAKWKLFEQLWGIKNLAQEKCRMLETGSSPQRSREIDEIFRD